MKNLFAWGGGEGITRENTCKTVDIAQFRIHHTPKGIIPTHMYEMHSRVETQEHHTTRTQREALPTFSRKFQTLKSKNVGGNIVLRASKYEYVKHLKGKKKKNPQTNPKENMQR